MKYLQHSKESLQHYTMYMKSKMKLHKQLYMQVRQFNNQKYDFLCLYKKLYLDLRAVLVLLE